MARLTSDDEGYLKEHFPGQWEMSEEGGKGRVLIRGYRLPAAYEPEAVDVMILIPPGYPAANLDMFYFLPAVSRKDGASIAALSMENHFGQDWQRWSRHYEWQAGVHCLATHLQYMENTLCTEAG